MYERKCVGQLRILIKTIVNCSVFYKRVRYRHAISIVVKCYCVFVYIMMLAFDANSCFLKLIYALNMLTRWSKCPSGFLKLRLEPILCVRRMGDLK